MARRILTSSRNSSAAAILARIDRRIAALQTTENAASAKAGSRDTIRSIRKNVANGVQRGVSTETLERLAIVLKTTVVWLAREEGPEHVEPEHIESADILRDRNFDDTMPDDGISTVKPYRAKLPQGQPVVSSALSAGGGSAPQTTVTEKGGIIYSADAVLGEIVLPQPVQSSLSAAPSSRIHWFEVRGDSMEPTLHGGDWVGVNTTDLAIGQGGVFALRDASGEILVKRLRRLRGDQANLVEIVSDNPRQGTDTEQLEAITVFGRIVARISRVG